MTTVLHVITGLATGGAEMMLLKLVRAMDRDFYRHVVVSMIDKGNIGERIEELGIPVHSLGISDGPSLLRGLRTLVRLTVGVAPDVIQGWMYHANLAALLAARVSRGKMPILWNVRASLDGLVHEKRSTAAVIRMGAWTSRWADGIIYNSRVSARQHEDAGYVAARTEVIPNGFDCAEFRPDKRAWEALRSELGVDASAVLVGAIGRSHPMKDHETFVAAAGIALRRDPRLHFVLAGYGVDWNNPALCAAIAFHGVGERVHLLGERRDIPSITAGLDLACLSSAWGEGFPNVLGEAMACGVPCVTTDTGDSAWLVDDCGVVVPARNAEALAAAILRIVGLGVEQRSELGVAARNRILENFSLEAIARRYEGYYRQFTDRHY